MFIHRGDSLTCCLCRRVLTVSYHKMTKGLMFLQSEIDEWLKRGAQKSEEELLQEAKAFVLSKKGKEV